MAQRHSAARRAGARVGGRLGRKPATQRWNRAARPGPRQSTDQATRSRVLHRHHARAVRASCGARFPTCLWVVGTLETRPALGWPRRNERGTLRRGGFRRPIAVTPILVGPDASLNPVERKSRPNWWKWQQEGGTFCRERPETCIPRNVPVPRVPDGWLQTTDQTAQAGQLSWHRDCEGARAPASPLTPARRLRPILASSIHQAFSKGQCRQIDRLVNVELLHQPRLVVVHRIGRQLHPRRALLDR